MSKKIIVPLDGSKQAESILSVVEEIAQQDKAKVILLQITDEPLMLGYDEVVDVTNYRSKRKQQLDQVESYLDGLKEEFQSKGIETSINIACGPVLNSILNTAENNSADLIALASHGLDGSDQSVRRSITVGLLQRAGCPILVKRVDNGDRF